ncbi:hypothetical protein [Corallococcus macrosporus]|uniref:hypothetical protein n=1 Tax=Corallococcus macrosporus TaxID=35 RepID=UPI0003159FBA|nr:hypothetical protein [Corallococcus macrosporus]
MDVFAGGGEVQAWTTTHSISRHNCTDNKTWVVLFHPASGKMLVLEGNAGYGSQERLSLSARTSPRSPGGEIAFI